ncbi:hypothetical protein [Tunturiibacter gelidiferens]|uniref:hypothetical protein n=1 Tax=Tunturiibacter gelidiferens TaxID=3069689 RepID=UPI003D9BCDFA
MVLVAGPLEGTPIAENAIPFLTLCLNTPTPQPWTVFVPALINEFLPFIEQLMPGSATVQDAQTSARRYLRNVKIITVAGDKFSHGWAASWAYEQARMTNQSHDGVVPVRSALLSDFVLSNLERLRGNDPSLGDYPYPFDHTHLVDNPVVMQDIIRILHPSLPADQGNLVRQKNDYGRQRDPGGPSVASEEVQGHAYPAKASSH